MKQTIKASHKILICIFSALSSITLTARHPFRLPNTDFPLITTAWKDSSKTYSMRTPYVRLHPLFTFRTEDFLPYQLPKESIPYVNDPTRTMKSEHLSSLVEHALNEIKQKKKIIKKNKELTHFKVLQHKNFNYKKSCGLIVLKFKQYPLVVKLFLEDPATFLQFRSTGIEPTFFFYMGGGANRHLSGFTRIKNREAIIEKVKKSERWRDYVTFPRKWFWFPRHQQDIILQAHNLAGQDTVQTNIPGVYAIIADEIDMKMGIEEIPHKTKSHIIMQLCNDLDMFIDPHEKNYVFSKTKYSGKFKITVVDTEHFPTMVGILKRKKFKNHSRWYAYLAGKCLVDMYFQTKRDLLNAQGKISLLALM